MTTSDSVKDIGVLDFEQAVIEESRRRPVVVDFWASWCGPCRILGPILEKLAAEFGGDFLLAKVDIDAHPPLAQQLRIRSIPNVKVFKDGAIVDEMIGALPEGEVRDFLRRHCPTPADRVYEKGRAALARGGDARADFEGALHLDPSHAGSLIELGKILLAQGDAEGAAALWGRVPYFSPLADQATRLKNSLQLHTVCMQEGGPQVCAERAAANPQDLAVRYAQGCCLAAEGRYREALDNFIYVVERNKKFRDQAAREAMLTVFALAGERSDLAEEYRRRLAMALF